MNLATYLSGSVGLVVAVGACGTIGMVGRRCLVPDWAGPAAWLVAIILALTGALLPALALGTFGLLTGWSWLLLVVVVAALLWRFRDRLPRTGTGRPDPAAGPPPAPGASALLNATGLAVAAAAFGVFAAASAAKFGTGMTVFDTNWYHGPLAVEMAKTGNTFALHQLTPAFISWFYPQNSELVHSLGILLFGNDLLSPFINLGWFAGCLLAAWAIGRPWGAAPISMAGAALILGSAAMSDQAGEARNDIVGAFFVLAGLAILINATTGNRRLTVGPALVIGLAAGLLAGTKVNFIPAGGLLVVAAIWLAAPEARRRVALVTVAGSLAGGGYWYLRNLVHSGNPLPWLKQLGPFTLPGPGQEMGGRQAGSVAGYLGDPEVIRHWFLSGLHDGFGVGWPIVLVLSLAGMLICLPRGAGRARRAGALIGLALFLAWFFAPTSASGYRGIPGGFFTGLRYLTPALLVGMALLGSGTGTRSSGTKWLVMGLIVLLAPFTIAPGGDSGSLAFWAIAVAVGILVWTAGMLLLAATGRERAGDRSGRGRPGRSAGIILPALAAVTVILVGFPVQRYYFAHRYVTADYTTAGLEHAFRWARGIENERIGTTASREYPLFGRLLENQVGFIGDPRPRGGFVFPPDCRTFREAVNRGGYRYLVLAIDRIEPDKSFPPEATWVAGDPAAKRIYRGEGTAIYRLEGPLDPDACP